MIKFLKSYIVYILTFILASVWFISYSNVPFIFFQQDELMGFGLFILRGVSMLYNGFGFKDVVHFVPVTMSISYNLFSIFGLNPIPYNIIGLIFHTINGLLIFFIAQKIFKSKLYSLLATILFFANSVGNELVMWPVINLNTLSLTFSLVLLLVLTHKYIERGFLRTYEWMLVSILFLLSVFSVEYAAGMIIVVPVIALILDRKNKGVRKIKALWPFWITVAGYLSLRFVPAFLSNEKNALETVAKTGIFEIVANIIRLSLVYISQLFFGQDLLINISQFISSTFFNNTSNTQFAEEVLYRYVSTLIGIIMILFLTKVYRKSESHSKSDSFVKKNILIFSAFILISSLPFVLVPGRSFSIFPSRYLYFGSVGYSLLLTTLYVFYSKFVKTKGRLILVSILAIFVATGTYQNHKRGKDLFEIGKERILILNSIKDAYPKLPQKTVFFIESNRSYYGLPDEVKILPFQSGFGQTLVLWYYSTEKFSSKFFENEFLWDILSEGYKEEDSRGFGYFRNYDKLKEALVKNKLDFTSVISFKWDYYTSSLVDNTKEVQLKLKDEIQPKGYERLSK